MSASNSPTEMVHRDENIVVASVLSHNSIDVIGRVIDGISSQTRRPDHVVIVDNGSDADTRGFLNGLPEAYDVIQLEENIGVGAGHNVGLRKAFEAWGADFVWTLENDSIPPAECLKHLLKSAQALRENDIPFGCIVPKQIHPDEHEDYLRPAHPLPLSQTTFNGVLIPRTSIERVGFLREDFFVDQEDREFADRLIAHGIPPMEDPEATITHLGKGRHRRETPSILRTYYRFRNETYLKTRLRKKRWSRTEALVRALVASLRTIAFEDQKRRRLMARWFGLADGLRGKLGRADHRFLAERHINRHRTRRG